MYANALVDSLSDIVNLLRSTLFHLCIEDIEDVNAREERILALLFHSWNTGVSDWTNNSRQSVMLSLVLTFVDNRLASRRMIHEWFTHDSTRFITGYMDVQYFFFLTMESFSEKILETIKYRIRWEM